jgi:hypothetical protein
LAREFDLTRQTIDAHVEWLEKGRLVDKITEPGGRTSIVSTARARDFFTSLERVLDTFLTGKEAKEAKPEQAKTEVCLLSAGVSRLCDAVKGMSSFELLSGFFLALFLLGAFATAAILPHPVEKLFGAFVTISFLFLSFAFYRRAAPFKVSCSFCGKRTSITATYCPACGKRLLKRP